MLGFLGTLVAGQAVRKATSYVTKRVTTKTWRGILKSGLESLCESFEWAEDDLESCRITNVVLRTDTVNELLARVGLRLAARSGCQIDSIVIKITLKMKSDLGLFSEPWHIEVVGLTIRKPATKWGTSIWELQIYGDGSKDACKPINNAS